MGQLKPFGWLLGEDSLKSAEPEEGDCRLTFGDMAKIPGLSGEWGISLLSTWESCNSTAPTAPIMD